MADDLQQAPSVLFREVETKNSYRIGFAWLNSERSLNALSLDMIQRLDSRFARWADDPAVVCVVLHGAGEKAFSAGGDVRSLALAVRTGGRQFPNPDALAFFGAEYRLDYRIHRYEKPILVWGSGIVLGGGLGLMVGASHRVATETSRIAMPEINIGLFPDVGGSWFLPRMPGASGLFMALAAAALNSADARFAGLADYVLRTTDREALFTQLPTCAWSDDARANHDVLTTLLNAYSARNDMALQRSPLRTHAETIASWCDSTSLETIVTRMTAYAGDDPWLRQATKTLAAGSPASSALIWTMQQRAMNLSLADTLRLELVVALQCCAHPDFREGVRAVLIDKDHQPQWSPKTLAEVTPESLANYFVEPEWAEGVHPLADLE